MQVLKMKMNFMWYHISHFVWLIVFVIVLHPLLFPRINIRLIMFLLTAGAKTIESKNNERGKERKPFQNQYA